MDSQVSQHPSQKDPVFSSLYILHTVTEIHLATIGCIRVLDCIFTIQHWALHSFFNMACVTCIEVLDCIAVIIDTTIKFLSLTYPI